MKALVVDLNRKPPQSELERYQIACNMEIEIHRIDAEKELKLYDMLIQKGEANIIIELFNTKKP